jgi:hypothetical protein
MKDYYNILGVDANCTTEDIKDAYRKLSKKFHPDLNQNDIYFENRFKELQEAYGILSDPKARKWYDEKFNQPKTSPPDPEPTKQRRYPRTTAIDIIFTIVLIGITIVFGKYVVASMSGPSKASQITKAPVIADTPQVVVQPVMHHKKKKRILLADNNPVKRVIPVVKAPVASVTHPVAVVKTIKALPKINTDTFKPKPVAVIAKPVQPVRTVSNSGDNDIPYSSYLRSNITGVVNMHRTDNIGSDILAVIPSHSKVLVLQKGDNYYKVEYNGDEGYVPKWTVLTK